MEFFGRYVLGGIIPLSLIGLGIFFLIYLRFFFVLKPKKTFSFLLKKEKGEGVSGFGALTVALAGTLGVGNIVGVASAIILGGAGAVFWMLVSAFSAMVLKYAEIVLAHKHRKNTAGGLRGGAMYYIEDFFGGRMGRTLGCIFSFFCLLNSLSMGCMLQSNAVSSSFAELSPVPKLLIGVILALLCGSVILKNIHDISPLTSIIIPLMTVLYFAMSVVVIVRFRADIGSVTRLILEDAFAFDSAAGGVFGFLLSSGVRYGCMRGILSNEAGCGTAPIAHAVSKREKAAEQGIWGIVEVFVDTVLLCTLTAFSILLAYGGNIKGFGIGDEMKLVISAYSRAIGSSAALLMTVMVFFFAFATIICWAYYGSVTLEYMTRSKAAGLTFKLVYTAFVFLGACEVGKTVWNIADIAIAGMTLLNLATLFLMRKEIKKETEDLFTGAVHEKIGNKKK